MVLHAYVHSTLAWFVEKGGQPEFRIVHLLLLSSNSLAP